MTTGAAKWLRRVERVLAVVGVVLLGGAIAATVWRWDYQARQERAFDRDANPVVELASLPEVQSPEAQRRAQRAAAPFPRARIVIPRIGVRAMVKEGVDDATLALAVGHVDGTARPGEEGNIVLAGHRDTFFRGLRSIRLDDRVQLDVPHRSYEYRVVSLEVVVPSETRVLEPRGGEELTLVTCHPFEYIGSAPNRFIVRAARVE
jgi:sortase A